MKPIAEITDRRLARRILDHVGLPSEPSHPSPARGPPELVDVALWEPVEMHRGDLSRPDFAAVGSRVRRNPLGLRRRGAIVGARCAALPREGLRSIGLLAAQVDQWDGFRSERAQILQALAGVENVVVLSGDLHGNYAAHLRPDFDDPSAPATAVEFTVTGISSISLQEQLDIFAATVPALAGTGLDQVTHLFDDNVRSTGSHFVYAHSAAYGCAIVDVDGELRVRFEEIERVDDPSDAGARTTVAFRVAPGSSTLERV